MDFLRTTKAYYSEWVGDKNLLFDDGKGVFEVYSPERNRVQYGYGERFDLYIFIREGQTIISYGDSLRERIGEIAGALHDCRTAEEASRKIERLVKIRPSHHIKYVFEGDTDRETQARPLNMDEYPLYRDFFVKCNPGCKSIDWLQEYFEEMAAERICCACIEDGAVVSCTDAPGMSYMQESVQEIGINTLESYRRKGYAAQACIACIREIIRNGKCPVWSAAADNMASGRLAQRAGFREFAEVLTITL